MLLIACPYCGNRPEIEFSYGGEAHRVRAAQPALLDDQAWTDFLYMRSNTKGVYAERWRHARGCGRYFNALRETTTDHFLAFYKTGEPRPPLDSLTEAAREAGGPGTAGNTGGET
ncbi:MAG TPA: sarcosine oxidase subunit delta [Steroidobacteraceae bacterium]|nr:sarcosine oxidase subunit delta [Steroidobacteraceae bacterium]